MNDTEALDRLTYVCRTEEHQHTEVITRQVAVAKDEKRLTILERMVMKPLVGDADGGEQLNTDTLYRLESIRDKGGTITPPLATAYQRYNYLGITVRSGGIVPSLIIGVTIPFLASKQYGISPSFLLLSYQHCRKNAVYFEKFAAGQGFCAARSKLLPLRFADQSCAVWEIFVCPIFQCWREKSSCIFSRGMVQ